MARRCRYALRYDYTVHPDQYKPGVYPDLTADCTCPSYGRPAWLYTVMRLGKLLELGQITLSDMDYWHLTAIECLWAERARHAHRQAKEAASHG